MDPQFRDVVLARWQRYFGEAPLPVAFYYTDQERPRSVPGQRCLICNVAGVLDGTTFVYDAKTPGCAGGKRYTGFADSLRPNFDYFLSCGIPGKMEGERYKQSPELVRAYLEQHPPFEAPGRTLVFKRWDKLEDDEVPMAAIFFATPDVLAGLYTLANYDVVDPYGVVAPMGSGCASIVAYPSAEAQSENPRCILGMFDVSARPCVADDVLTFTVPLARLQQMVGYMDESFLITQSWRSVRDRINTHRTSGA